MTADAIKIFIPPDGGYITRSIIFILVVAVMVGIAQRITNIDKRLRGGLLALAVAVSVGIHVGLSPEHLKDMPRLGESFIVASVVGAVIAIALLARPDDRRIVAAAGIFCLGQMIAWLLFVVVPVPFFPGTPEQVETIAVISKAVEAVGVVLAVGLVGSPATLLRSAGPLRRSPGTHLRSPGTHLRSPGTHLRSPGTHLRSPGSAVQTSAHEPAGAAEKRWPDGHLGLPPKLNETRDNLVR